MVLIFLLQQQTGLNKSFSLPKLTRPPLSSFQNHPTQKTMKDFKPISLCNVLFKIIFKSLANRLKPLLQKCISPEQSSFVEGRSILNNELIPFEFFHHMKCKTKGKTGEKALKIDISKAFDKVQ